VWPAYGGGFPRLLSGWHRHAHSGSPIAIQRDWEHWSAEFLEGHLSYPVLAYFHKFPYAEIGGILGIRVGTVKSRLHTAATPFAEDRNVATICETAN
jgi:hypothetical protein